MNIQFDVLVIEVDAYLLVIFCLQIMSKQMICY